jgi:spermidine synthase
MIPWEHLDTGAVPGSPHVLKLYRHGRDFSIRVDGAELMNNRAVASEQALSQLGCERIAGLRAPRVLIGGLGMGFSLRAALDALPAAAEVVVSELVPKVVAWNRELLGHLAGHPLQDARVSVREADVAQVLREAQRAYDLILLDVDNGPEGLTRNENSWIYARAGLSATLHALRPQGVVGYWSSALDPAFVRRLQEVGFEVDEHRLRSVGKRRGARHVVWLAHARAGGRPQPASQGQRR